MDNRRIRHTVFDIWTLFLLFHPLAIALGGGSEESIGAGVEGRLDRVLHNADDEADADGLHGHVAIDAEQGTGNRDEQQRTARYTRGATSGQGGDDAQHQGGQETDLQPRVWQTAKVITVMVTAAPFILMVAPSGMLTE